MRRWNGWGDEKIIFHIPSNALDWLKGKLGELFPPDDVSYEDVILSVPNTQLTEYYAVQTGAEERVQHARGQSLPDWVAMRSGHVDRFPDGVAYPESEDDLRDLFIYARRIGAVLIPYGGGTSVVGGINPESDGPPVITVDLARMSRFIHLDQKSRLATFGTGIRGPYIEAALRTHGFMLGHFPQSFELSTLGGWIATRSSGQQSLCYGRIEHHFAGGRLVAPSGTMLMNPYPASAAGPDLRELVLGSEGRMGIISEATIRIASLPQREEFHAIFFPYWEAGVEAVREIVQSGLSLSMLRLSNPVETEANLILAGHENLVTLAHTGLEIVGQKRGQKCMLILGMTGDAPNVRHALHITRQITHRYSGVHVGQYIGKMWAKSRFKTPYMRNSLWEQGVAVDTLETVVPWTDVLPAAQAIVHALEQALQDTEERVFVFAHLSHLYPTGASIYITFLFRVLSDPQQMLEYWQRMKHAASMTIIEHGGTITHQHGVGRDHAPYLEAEKGNLGIKLIANAIRECDPDGILNPGKLVYTDKIVS